MNSAYKITRPLIGFALILFAAGVANAQQSPQQVVKHGEEVFAATCTGFCHGDKGTTGGGAPRLAGRGFSAQYIEKTVTYGVAGTAMPAWALRLPLEDTKAVIAYVQSLNGIGAAGGTVPAPALSEDAAKGRDLFADTTYDMRRCWNCHVANGRGVSVAPISKVPANVAALRSLTTPDVQTATENGKPFPAVMVGQSKEETRVYDLTAAIPTLRVFPPSGIQIANGSDWKHSSALKGYSDEELSSILAFLRAVQEPPSGASGDQSGGGTMPMSH